MKSYGDMGYEQKMWLRRERAPRNSEEAKSWLLQHLVSKVVHGEYFKTVTNRPADKRLSALWLTRGVLQSKTKAFIVAMQDGVTKLLAYNWRIIIDDVNLTCRICGNGDETLGHVLTSCVNSLYHLISLRHDAVVRVLETAVIAKLGNFPTKKLRCFIAVI